jgi:RNA polymerase sigma factor (sigma-70 family)
MNPPAKPTTLGESDASMSLLVAHRAEFLAFLERRLRDRALAEDVLQDALVKGLSRLHTVEKPESLVPWFYRLLRTTLIDDRRRAAARGRAFDALGAEPAPAAVDDAPAKACECLHEVVESMTPAHADVLQRVAIDEVAVKDYAAEVGISSGNAAVRSFRAREALRRSVVRACGSCAEQGCVDCTCTRGDTSKRVT